MGVASARTSVPPSVSDRKTDRCASNHNQQDDSEREVAAAAESSRLFDQGFEVKVLTGR
jgi:hypothetical protein